MLSRSKRRIGLEIDHFAIEACKDIDESMRGLSILDMSGQDLRGTLLLDSGEMKHLVAQVTQSITHRGKRAAERSFK